MGWGSFILASLLWALGLSRYYYYYNYSPFKRPASGLQPPPPLPSLDQLTSPSPHISQATYPTSSVSFHFPPPHKGLISPEKFAISRPLLPLPSHTCSSLFSYSTAAHFPHPLSSLYFRDASLSPPFPFPFPLPHLPQTSGSPEQLAIQSNLLCTYLPYVKAAYLPQISSRLSF